MSQFGRQTDDAYLIMLLNECENSDRYPDKIGLLDEERRRAESDQSEEWRRHISQHKGICVKNYKQEFAMRVRSG